MTTRRFKMEDGSTKLFTLVGDKWVDAEEQARKDIAGSESGLSAFTIAAG